MGSQEIGKEVAHREEDVAHREESPGVGKFHGGFGSASLRECVNLITQTTNVPSAPCHSEGSAREPTPHVTDPSQVTSPNVEQNPPQDSTPAREPPTAPSEDADQRPKKRERKEEDLTPKSTRASRSEGRARRESFSRDGRDDPQTHIHFTVRSGWNQIHIRGLLQVMRTLVKARLRHLGQGSESTNVNPT